MAVGPLRIPATDWRLPRTPRRCVSRCERHSLGNCYPGIFSLNCLALTRKSAKS